MACDGIFLNFSMERWMKILTCAGYEYMKLMVADLQRQLDELDRAKGDDSILYCDYNAYL